MKSSDLHEFFQDQDSPEEDTHIFLRWIRSGLWKSDDPSFFRSRPSDPVPDTLNCCRCGHKLLPGQQTAEIDVRWPDAFAVYAYHIGCIRKALLQAGLTDNPTPDR